MKHPCHNREFPKTTIVRDGWHDTIDGRGLHIMVPRMKEIPFAFSMDDGCVQWKEPYGAIHEGHMDPTGCKKCKWRPDTFWAKEKTGELNKYAKALLVVRGYEDNVEIMVRRGAFVCPVDPHKIIKAYMCRYEKGEPIEYWRPADIKCINGTARKGDHMRIEFI